MLGHVPVFLHQCFGDDDLLYAVLPFVLVDLFSHHIALGEGCSHLESRVHTDAVDAIEHLCVHASHRRADDEVGLLCADEIPQQFHRLLGMYGEVGGDDGCLGHVVAQNLCGVGGSG